MTRPDETPPVSAAVTTFARDTPPDVLLVAAADGDRRALARLLTQVEKGGPTGRAAAALAYRAAVEAQTVGITGPPGAGKSTLVARMIGVARAGGSSSSPCWPSTRRHLSPAAPSSVTVCACRNMLSTTACTSGPWRRAVNWVVWL